MDVRPVGEDRLEVIDSGSSERRYSAMRDQAERGRDFQRRVRGMWLCRELAGAPSDPPVIELGPTLLRPMEAPQEQRQQDSA